MVSWLSEAIYRASYRINGDLTMAEDAEQQKDLIFITDEEEQKKAESDYPLLDLTQLINDHRKSIAIVFQPQGYRIVMTAPPALEIEKARARHEKALEKHRGQETILEDLMERKKQGEELEEEAEALIQEYQHDTLPFSLHVLLLCIQEPEGMTPEQLRAWLQTLQPNQIEVLFQKATELVRPVGPQEEAGIKN